jgi:hypothetical protein
VNMQEMLDCGNFRTCYIPEMSRMFVLQEEYLEHRAAVGQCRFNSSGSTAVSADVDGVVKLWTVTPTPK